VSAARVARRVAAVGACCVFVCGCGKSSAKKEVVVGQKSARGLHASAVASVTAPGPGGLAVRVTAAPRQRVRGSWTVSCRQGTSSSRDADDFAGRAPLTVATRPFGSPGDTCTVVGVGTLTGSGHVKVELLGR
jgi:hypothetical protein